jgi:signal transduction histidine kinase
MDSVTAQQQLARRQSLADIAFALVLGTVMFLVTAFASDAWSLDDRRVDAWALALVATAFLALTMRRRWPLTTLGVTTAAAAIYLLASFPYGPILLAFAVAVYTVVDRLPLAKAGPAVLAAAGVLLTHIFVHPDALGGWLGLLPGSAWAAVPFAIGTTVRTAREAKGAARAESVRQQIYDERLRLAQEVHDVVGHGLAAIQMQADVALHVDEEQSPKTRSTLEAISRASSEAFEELQNTLDVIHQPQVSPRTPSTPGLAEIEGLCDRMETAGVEVALDISGSIDAITQSVGMAAYRVVQESLTNIIRHGAVPSASVEIMISDDVMDLKVANPGPVPTTVSDGRGIKGMQRRVSALGGTFHAGATSEGFAVTAQFPIQGSS